MADELVKTKSHGASRHGRPFRKVGGASLDPGGRYNLWAGAYYSDRRTRALRTFNYRGERLLPFHPFRLRLCRHTSFKHLSHFRGNLGELGELGVIAAICGFNVRKINDDRA